MSHLSETGSVNGERLNFILALCAILVSVASFYATYLQADSAERQVKAMTLPLIQFTHGNYNDETKSKEISLELINAGVGPAIIHSVSFEYAGQSYPDINQYLKACCADGVDSFVERRKDNATEAEGIGGWVSKTLNGVILPGQSDYQFQQIVDGDSTAELWTQLNKERWKLALNICYCSMLDECFVTQQNGIATEVQTCAVQ